MEAEHMTVHVEVRGVKTNIMRGNSETFYVGVTGIFRGVSQVHLPKRLGFHQFYQNIICNLQGKVYR